MQCQNERSQQQNRAVAMRVLKSRLLELEIKRRDEELAKERGEAQDISFGSQIRSYVLHPYTMVNDHRTGLKDGNATGCSTAISTRSSAPTCSTGQRVPTLTPSGICREFVGDCFVLGGSWATLVRRGC